ncbi:MAG TPA: sigma-70 family RNA polymerase sigma factor [Polyangia bacterium]|jgi:RNA polymerase sigma-70 factor (ECF subfamily)|nr:sigma-70 family RNA polymerase sigma factor [Polyangia bacterium]
MRGPHQRSLSSPPARGPLTFAEVYEAHAATVARWAARLGGPAADVEDVTQEVFVVVNRRLKDFREDGRLSTWLFGITAKVAANERRRRKLRHWWLRLSPGAGDDAPAPADGALEQLEKRERRVLFHRALDQLNERHRRALVLFELEELSIDDVAAYLGLRPGNTRVLLHRARAAFLKSMVACELQKELR